MDSVTGKPPESQLEDGVTNTENNNETVIFENSIDDKSHQNPNLSKWNTVQGKRARESPIKNNPMKQAKLDSYWLSDPNRYKILQTENDNEEEEESHKVAKPEKPPPIFVDNLQIKKRTHL